LILSELQLALDSCCCIASHFENSSHKYLNFNYVSNDYKCKYLFLELLILNRRKTLMQILFV
jgi:hypothetical protein